jgi:glutamyl/glutaminyl-tRNA synthetase
VRCTSAAPAPPLYNWLLARGPARGGTLVLRIEDTDRERSTPENVEQILDALAGWARLGRGPDLPDGNAPAPQEALEQLLAGGHAYHSNATADDVKAYKESTAPTAASAASPSRAARSACACPTTGETVVDDVIRGETSFPNASMDDPVIARADGSRCSTTSRSRSTTSTPDHPRGARRGPPLQHAQAAARVRGARAPTPPRYAHLPLLHGPDGKKLSKRHGAASVQELRDAGYLPEAVDNYIALLGAGFAADEEFFTMPEELASASGSSASRRTRPCSTSRSCAHERRTCASWASTS